MLTAKRPELLLPGATAGAAGCSWSAQVVS